MPRGWDEGIRHLQDMAHIDVDAADGYDQLGLQIADFDLLFAFPWPGEERFWHKLFDQRAAHGALLLTYHGMEGFRLRRRVRALRRGRGTRA